MGKESQSTLNQMLVDIRDRYLAHVNAECPKRKADRERYSVKREKIVIAAQCLIASGATTDDFDGWHFENNFDIKTFWPNFLYNLDRNQNESV